MKKSNLSKSVSKKAAIVALSAASVVTMAAPMSMQAFAASKSKVPAPVAKLALTQNGKSKVTVSWTKAKNAAYYRVYTASGSKYVRAAQTKAAKATLNVKRGKTLKVKVRGINGKKLGRFSAAKSLYVQADPAAPAVSTTVEKDGSITANWKADKNADKYTVYISTDRKAFSKAGTTKGTSVTVKANDLDVKYVKVTAANEYAKASSSAVEVGKSSIDPGKTESTGSQSGNKDAGKTDTKIDVKKNDEKGVIDGKAVVMSDSLFRKTFNANSKGKTIKVKRPVGTGVDTVKLNSLSVDKNEGYEKASNSIGGTTATGNYYDLS
jgi:fibronectin type 3 domain-containing protein